MRPLVKCIALFMAALWLPATQHCMLDAIGLIEAHVIDHDHQTGCDRHTDTTQHAHDTCVLVEFSSWLDTAENLNAPAPSARDACACLIETLSAPSGALCVFASPPPAFPSDPPDWLPSRHFTERTAPVSRAPAASLA
ncbi:hypothetical protein M2103_000260 [Ereboglobus sp. PH5-5]|uniref:hypothetical protein n=1 Tax=Ereboglobus sp. PH5-5 TaxID=2940529 RepID=UPI0024060589|nr:hypothetical protein [Ereboglobus sp. PH5-5]MDF9832052.1 hypothetical protein [Ereboglobus sp. PH5-5]